MGSGINKRAREVIKPVLQRVGELENAIQSLAMNQQQILEAANGAVARLQNRCSVLEDVANALAECVGRDKAEAEVKKIVEGRAVSRSEQEKAALKAALDDGKLRVTEEITNTTVLVGREFTADGTVRVPGWQQCLFTQVEQELQSSFLGKKVGDLIDIPAGKFEVLELYEVVMPKEGEQLPPDLKAEAQPVPEGEANAEEVSFIEPAPAPLESVSVDDEDADAALEAYMATEPAAETTEKTE